MELQFCFDGEVDVVSNEEQVEAAVTRLRDDAAAGHLDSAKVVGFDMEWHAPRVRGISPSKTALIQVCSSAEYCAVFLVAVLDEVPASLWAFLRDRTVKKVRSFRLLFRFNIVS